MGKFSADTMNRIQTNGPDFGFCAICRDHGKLTKDHVPPKGCGNVDNLMMKRVFGHTALDTNSGVKARGGLSYKTLCSRCNNELLGAKYDHAFVSVVREVTSYLYKVDRNGLMLPTRQSFKYEPNRFLRSVFGHLLAAVPKSDLLTLKNDAPFDNALRAYVLNPASVLPDEIEVYFWLYPYRDLAIVKHGACVFIGTDADAVYGHVFKFFPFGFWVLYRATTKIKHRTNLHRLGVPSSMLLNQEEELVVDLRSIHGKGFPENIPDAVWAGNKNDLVHAEPETMRRFGGTS